LSIKKFQGPDFKFKKAGLFFFFLAFMSFESFAEESANALVQSELSFAKTASEKGIKTAFLSYLAEDSILFRPHAVSGKEWTAAQPETPGVLIWEPSYAEISGSGDLGFTTGPYVYKTLRDSADGDYGQFFSLWKKQNDGTWKVLLDAGIYLEKQKEKTALVTRTGKGSAASKQELEKQKKILEKADLGQFVTTDALLLHDQEYGTNCSFVQNGSGISLSADLAYFYGAFQCGATQGNYVRVWRKVEHWQVAVDYRKHL
jgi:ketosteroid isomerase-like protein